MAPIERSMNNQNNNGKEIPMIKQFLALVGLSIVSLAASAALYDRGNGLIYDDVLDITWLQDANYAMTSGYDSDGKMTWSEAISWAESLEYEGYSNWRLTSVGDSPPDDFYDPTTELGHMFTTNLNNPSGIDCTPGCLQNSSFIDGDSGEIVGFINMQWWFYWFSEEAAGLPVSAWTMYFIDGGQLRNHKGNQLHAWAVTDGDVAAIPLPAAVWLFGSALIGLLGVSRRKGR